MTNAQPAPTDVPDILGDGRDPQTRPQDDLYGHVNGRWEETSEIPADLPGYGAFVQLRLDAEKHVAAVLEEARGADAAPGTTQQKLGDMYASFLDEETVDALGHTPIDDLLALVDGVDDLASFSRTCGRLTREGVGGPLAFFVDTDAMDPDRYVVLAEQSGLGLPDEAYYRDEQFAEVREAYVEHVAAMLSLIGHDAAAAADAARVMALETALAAHHWDNVTTRDVVKSYNLKSRVDAQALAPAFDLDAWAEGAAAPSGAIDEIVVRQPSFVEGLQQVLTGTSLDDWRLWLRWHVAHAFAPYLSDAFVATNFAFYGRVLAGTEQLRDRWKRGVAVTEGALGEAIGELYVARHFPPEHKARMDELVANLVEAYRRSISKLDWMSAETRDKALAKLGRFTPKIGYPDRWRDYSTLQIEPGDLVGNVRRAHAFEHDRELAKIGSPVDRGEWFMYPQTVNAYYNPGTNEICFPAAILRPPFFDADADDAVNYGGIGAVIGHEIGHGFDDQGSQYDGRGAMVNWWTDDDRANFQQRADALIAQYDAMEPRELPGRHVNGALTVGENIGDLGGLTIGLQAYEIALGGRPAPEIDGRSGRKRVFENWALVWRGKYREAMAAQLLQVDPHSPKDCRANIARNLDEFHEEYATQPGDGMWLAPEERVHIW